MALEITTDMMIGIGALVVAAIAIFLFMRATKETGVDKSKRADESKGSDPIRFTADTRSRIQMPELRTVTERTQVEESRSKIRMLTLQQEILGMVMKRLFEAEDEGQISKEERERLSKNYESEIQHVSEELNKAELIVSLNELEEIRGNIIQEFQSTLADTQRKIDLIIGELKIEPPQPVETEQEKPKMVRKPPRRVRPAAKTEETEEEAEEPEEEGEEQEDESSRKRDTVEDRLDKLKQDVLKELEELDRLELEA
jgi:hypothetical protein